MKNITKTILFLIVLFVPFAAAAQAPEGMYMCKKASDCVVVADFCANNWRAIAKGQEQSFAEWSREMKVYVECNTLKPSAKPTATCDGNRCIVYSPVPGKK